MSYETGILKDAQLVANHASVSEAKRRTS